MAELRFKGFKSGTTVDLSATVNAATGSTAVPSFRAPLPVSALPRISDALDTGTLTLDVGSLSGPYTYVWSEVGGPVLGTNATLEGTGHGGKWIEVAVTGHEGTRISPPIMVYASMMMHMGMMGMPMMASHLVDDAAIVTTVPHAEATHIAIADGNWTDPAIWLEGAVPRNGAFVLIPRLRSVVFDSEEDSIRLDRVRVDGRLWVDTATLSTEHFKMLVETLVVTRGGDFEVGTAENRLPDTAAFTLKTSGKDYSAHSYTPTNLREDRLLQSRGWERGFIFQGRVSLWGAEKLTWSKAEPIEQGATGLYLHDLPVGLAVGDTIVIGGTDCTESANGPIWQDEERVVTGITGNFVVWADPLIYPHKNQLATSTRTDLYPNILVKGNKNITFTSEVTDVNHRRGHTAFVHHHCKVDVWDVQFIGMGRTDKRIKAGIIDGNDDFAVVTDPTPGPPTTSPLSSASNLTSRYSVHFHHVGFHHMGARPIMDNCYVEDVPGWGVVHHACDIDLRKVAVYKFFGCAIVSEQANEIGAWIDCLAMHTTNTRSSYISAPKTMEGVIGAGGDSFKHGYGFGYRGRMMRTNRCVANSSSWGHVFFPRSIDEANAIQFPLKGDRSLVDLSSVGQFTAAGDFRRNEWDWNHYPILHFADNESIGCIGGMFITKSGSSQFHDVNINLKRPLMWGCLHYGIYIEYVGNYLLSNPDVVSGQNGHEDFVGIEFGTNSVQIGTVGARIEGGAYAFFSRSGFTNYTHDQDDPRWFHIGFDAIDVDNVSGIATYIAGTPNDTAMRLEVDPGNTIVSYGQSPSETWPLVMGTLTVNGGWGTQVDNTDGQKVDNLSASGDLIPKKHGDQVFIPSSDSFNLFRIEDMRGHYTYGGQHALEFADIISDRITARPHKVTKLITTPTDGQFDGPDLGIFDDSATEVVANDIPVTCAKGGSVVINVPMAANPSGGDGTTFTLDAEDYIAADHGVAILDSATGNVTYSPDDGYTGVDEFYVFLKSGHKFATVRINILIMQAGTDSGVFAPVASINFTAADHADANTLAVQCLAPPDTGGRNITRTDYSTDTGATWRRLSNGWVQATHKITRASDGTAIMSGAYNLRLQYSTDYDFQTSSASGDDAATVT